MALLKVVQTSTIAKKETEERDHLRTQAGTLVSLTEALPPEPLFVNSTEQHQSKSSSKLSRIDCGNESIVI
jgi:hypothetical protein